MKKAIVFALSFVAHFVLQFVAWSYATSIYAIRSDTFLVIWNVVSAPLVYVAASLTNEYFWPVLIANSALWAAAVTLIVSRLLDR